MCWTSVHRVLHISVFFFVVLVVVVISVLVSYILFSHCMWENWWRDYSQASEYEREREKEKGKGESSCVITKRKLANLSVQLSCRVTSLKLIPTESVRNTNSKFISISDCKCVNSDGISRSKSKLTTSLYLIKAFFVG